MTIRVMVLGASGMLGSIVTDVLARDDNIRLTATVRRPGLIERYKALMPEVEWLVYDAATLEPPSKLADQEWIVNAIGITKPFIDDKNAEEIERAVQINTLFPFRLAKWSSNLGVKVLQIATDCVFSGADGRYIEDNKHDPLDVYGKTKSLGEVRADSMHHLRCSIIGREPKAGNYLLEWFLGQPSGESLKGFTNHQWNGVTTLHFAKICNGVICDKVSLPELQHIVPADEVSKYGLLCLFSENYDREDISILPTNATSVVDRTLNTNQASFNNALWHSAGYAEPPTVSQMIAELSAFDFRLV